MQQELQKLQNIFSTETDIFKKLLSLELDKNEVLLRKDLRLLEDITKKEELFVQDIDDIEKQRENVCKQLAEELELEEMTVSSVIQKIPDEYDNIKNGIKIENEKLLKSLSELQALNQMNNKIIKDSIDYFQYSINLLSGESQNEVYNMEGKENVSSQKNPVVIDRKV